MTKNILPASGDITSAEIAGPIYILNLIALIIAIIFSLFLSRII